MCASLTGDHMVFLLFPAYNSVLPVPVSSLSFSYFCILFTCIYVHVCGHVCVCYECRRQTLILNVLPIVPTFVFGRCLSLDLEFTDRLEEVAKTLVGTLIFPCPQG